ncbi:breast cancer anti-estrogen resistance protein 1 isoform X2 [Pantherophis guttatus]|uniref:Breast cancer anti-estrogen resistance protein 1 n=1 Tax=Pantherophis guttatus TaxID=94885 RepID=A0A6P9CEX3_PANGU|nr:breast cancer anti-estrogen resistance protein 1 isoform X2 [Pantherophis guttatus]
MNYLNVLAKALYDNVAESPDELSFRKGDIMTVLERNTQGLDGWWLCSLHGRQGIVPGNRLKILVGMYDKKQLPGPHQGPLQPSLPQPAGQTPLVFSQQGGYTPLSPASQYTPMHPSYLPQEDNVYLVPAPNKTPGAPGPFQSPAGKQISAYPKQSPSQAQDVYQVPAGPACLSQDIYQVPPSLDGHGWDPPKAQGKVVIPTRVGQVYVYETPKGEQQDEYDVPRQLQEIYDVPPTRGLMVNRSGQEVYDSPAMMGKTANSGGHEIYDVPPSVEKNLQGVYDIPPSVSKDVPDGPLREETYDVPPIFCKVKPFDPSRHPLILAPPLAPLAEPLLPEDVYDVPPPATKGVSEAQEIYDVPPGLRKLASQEVYDVPRELTIVSKDGEADYIYDVPPQADRADGKRLSASSTGSTRSNLSNSSLDTVPVREAPDKELLLDQDVAMETLARLQSNVNTAVSSLMSFISGSWRSPERMEVHAGHIRGAAESIKGSLRELLEFARGVVGSAAQASDRSLYSKLSKQVQKMEEVYQALLRHSQALEGCGWAPSALVASKPGAPDDLEHLVMYSRGVPDDTKQLASFLHGNASLLFRRTRGSPASSGEGGHPHGTPSEKASNIQSRPLPSPPKFLAQDSPDGQYENSEGGWMEDYDYVHLQGKEEFEKTQKELLERGNIIRQGKGQLEQQQLKQFERLEQEVTRPIDNDLSNWTPPQHYPHVRGSGTALGPSDRQLLLFYLEQCEANLTTLTNAVDAFFTAVNTNQPPKIFVAHSKFVILSAHKLVFIGDTLSRQAKAPEVRQKVTHYSNLLCDMLKEIVASTKTAALQYPSPAAAKDMVERVHELANSTQQFQMVLGQLTAL